MYPQLSSRSLRMLVPAALFVLASMMLCSTRVQANCCTLTIDWEADCPNMIINFDVVYPSNIHDFFPITDSGDNVYTVANCDPVTLQIVDACATTRVFPTTANSCIDVVLSGECCLHICCDSACHWTITDGHNCMCDAGRGIKGSAVAAASTALNGLAVVGDDIMRDWLSDSLC